MPTKWETFPIKLQGGLITNLGRIEQGINAPGSATILQNFEPDVRGGYTRIVGYQKYSTTVVPGSGQIFGVIALSETEALVARGTAYQYSTGTTWTAKLTLTNPAISRIRSDSYNFTGTRQTVVVDGVNPPAYFDHGAKTLVYAIGAPTDVVGASRAKVFKNHLFFAKGRILSFSSPFLSDDFNPANGAGTINIGDDITGLVVFRDQLIIFCLNSIRKITGSSVSDFILSPVAMNTGCLCGDTVQEIGGDLMYLGPDGIRYLSATERNNDFGLVRASEKIQKKVLAVTNSNCIYSSVTISEKNQYRLFYYIDTVPVDASRGFLATKYSDQSADDIAWAELVGFKVYGISKCQTRDGEIILFVSETGYVYTMEIGSSLDGANIEAIFETPYMPISDPKIRKTIYKHTLFVQPTGLMEISAALKYDYEQPDSSPPSPFTVRSESSLSVYGAASSIYGVTRYSYPAEEQYYDNVLGGGFTVAIRYRSNDTRPPYNLNFTILEYRTNERR